VKGSILIWLALGMGLRLLLLFQPPVEDNSWIRQTQTADAIQSWVDAGHPTWDAEASWRGDTGARLAQELPVFNLLVYLGAWAGFPLNVSGRLVSALLWGAGFLLLQGIWRRWLDDRETFWANLLFVFSPVSIAFGQAIMPEMLVQLLGLGLVILLFQYERNPSRICWWSIVAVGALGALIKLPGFSHYYVMLGLILFFRDRWKVFAQARLWVGGIFTLAVLCLWSRYTQSVNSTFFPEWTATANLQGFLGSWEERLQPAYWIRLFFYLFVLVGTPAAWLAVILGGTSAFKNWLKLPLLAPWLAGLCIMILLWGPRTCMGHAYYCLPFLIPLCAWFGKAAGSLLTREKSRAWGAPALGFALLAGCLPMAAYLLRPDPVLLQTTEWMKKNTSVGELAIIKANHSAYTREYPELPGFSYLSGRRTWIWTRFLNSQEKRRALETSTWVVETTPSAQAPWWEKLRKKIKRHERPVENIEDLLRQLEARLVQQSESFRAFRTNRGK
jgi:hypothetical protein